MKHRLYKSCGPWVHKCEVQIKKQVLLKWISVNFWKRKINKSSSWTLPLSLSPSLQRSLNVLFNFPSRYLLAVVSWSYLASEGVYHSLRVPLSSNLTLKRATSHNSCLIVSNGSIHKFDLLLVIWSTKIIPWYCYYLTLLNSVLVVRASDQSIIDRQGLLMQMLLVDGLKIVLFTSKRTVTNFMSVHRTSADKRLLPPTLVPRTDLCEFTLSLSSRPFTGDAAKKFITNDSWNRGSE